MKKSLRQLALEAFLNDEVTEMKKGRSFFEWRGKKYQCLTIKQAKTSGYRLDHFIKHEHNGRTFVIREVSDRLYSMLTLDN